MKAIKAYMMIDADGNHYENSIKGTIQAVFDYMDHRHLDWVGGKHGQMHWYAAGYRVIEVTVVWDEGQR